MEELIDSTIVRVALCMSLFVFEEEKEENA